MTVRVLIDGFAEVDDEDADTLVNAIADDGRRRELVAEGELTIRSDGPIAVTVEDADGDDWDDVVLHDRSDVTVEDVDDEGEP